MIVLLNAVEVYTQLGISKSLFFWCQKYQPWVYGCLLHPHGRGQRRYCSERLAKYLNGEPIAILRRVS